MGDKCKYVVTHSGDQKYRCNREVKKGRFCPMHNELVREVLEQINEVFAEQVAKNVQSL